MAINERLIDTKVEAAGNGGTGNQEEGLILHLDANDVDSYDGDGSVWYDITNHEYTPATNVDEHFNTVLYNTNGSATSITGVGFEPELVWIKRRDSSGSNYLFDQVRGVHKALISEQTYAEIDNSGYLTSFDSDGFSLGTNSALVGNGNSYAAWCFKAGGAAVSNTDGTITSQVSANNDLGFSIVSYTGTGSNATIGHGLNSAPELIFIKRIDASSNWSVYTPLGPNYYMFLNEADAAYSGSSLWWNNTAPTPSVFSTGSYGVHNTSSAEYIAYCFASKRGVSKVGSYTGNGSTTGPIVYLGFEPAFLMFKCSSQVGNWIVIDNKRATSNPRTPHLRANSNSADDSGTNEYVDFLGNGFQPKGVSNYNNNSSGQTYIYYAVAKNTKETSLTPDRASFTEGSVTTGAELELDANDYSGSGNWLDSSGNSNDGTISGATYVNDGSSDYFDFDGNDNVSVGHFSELESSARSWEFWVNFDDFSSLYFFAGQYGNSNATNTALFRTGGTGNKFVRASLYDGNGTFTEPTGSIPLTVNQWHHITYVSDNSDNSFKIYVDGVLDVDTNLAFDLNTSNTQDFFLGQGGTFTSFRINGQIGAFRFYSSALTPQQVQTNYDATKIYTLPGLELHLDIGNSNCYSGSGTTVNDLSSNNHTITTLAGVEEADFDKELGNFLTVKENSNEGLTIADNADFDHTNGATYEGWVYLDPSGTDEETFLWRGQSNGQGLRIYWHASYGWFPRDFNASGTEIIDQNNIKTGSSGFGRGKWYHLALTLSSASGATYKFYVDGNLIGYYTASGGGQNSLSYGISLGKYAGGSVSDLHGKIGQFRFYSSALSHDQVRQNYNFTKNNYPNGYDGTISNTTWNSSGYFDFNGSSSIINLPDVATFDRYSEIKAVSAWVKLDTTTSRVFPLSISSTTNSFDYWYFGWLADLGAIYVAARNGSSSNQSIATAAVTPDTDWHHIFCQVTDTTREIYLDGVSKTVTHAKAGSGTDTSWIDYPSYDTNAKGAIGVLRLASPGYSNGFISKIKVYNKTLTQAEITALYNEGE